MTVGLIVCAAITVLTTAGIIVVLGTQTIEFFSMAKVNLSEFLFGTTLKPDSRPPNSGSSRSCGGRFSSRPARA